MRALFGTRRRTALTGGVLAVAVAVLALPWAGDQATGLFFVPRQERKTTPAERGFAFEDVRIPAADGTELAAWRIPARPDAAHPLAVVVSAHGNYGNMTHQWGIPARLTEHGFEVLMFDYRGFGESPGSPTHRRAVEDLDAALDAAQARARELGGVPVALLGQSMGGALAVESAAKRKDLAGVALDSPFGSWPEVAWYHVGRGHWHSALTRLGLHALLGAGGADPVDLAPRLAGTPLLVLTGDADEVCPADQAEAIADRAGGDARLVVLAGAKHVGRRTLEQDASVVQDLVEFFTEVASPPEGGAPAGK